MDHQYPTLSKIPVLDTGKFEQWQFRIQQYLQLEHYALWEVIEFGDSHKVPRSTDSAESRTGRTITPTTDDMQKKKNDVKARTTLLLSLPDEHQLRFSKYKTAKELWAAILKTFGDLDPSVDLPVVLEIFSFGALADTGSFPDRLLLDPRFDPVEGSSSLSSSSQRLFNVIVSPYVSKPIIWDIGDKEEEYPFVNKYPSSQEEPIVLVEEESCPVYDTNNEEEKSMLVYDTNIEDVMEEEEGFVGKRGFCGEEYVTPLASPTGVLVLDTLSSSEANPSKSSPPPVSVAPMVTPFLCSDDSESDTKMPKRHCNNSSFTTRMTIANSTS
uniref:Uncharacterized protein n=1 Tax=Tanacetum cinerariifolium TaxID=118510 RepID=A0A6L2M195_TANCI|nr:hypothetical protein [Tanacetum cinerariifolium]